MVKKVLVTKKCFLVKSFIGKPFFGETSLKVKKVLDKKIIFEFFSVKKNLFWWGKKYKKKEKKTCLVKKIVLEGGKVVLLKPLFLSLLSRDTVTTVTTVNSATAVPTVT